MPQDSSGQLKEQIQIQLLGAQGFSGRVSLAAQQLAQGGSGNFWQQIGVIDPSHYLLHLGPGQDAFSQTSSPLISYLAASGDTVKLGNVSRTPVSSADPGFDGEFCWDSNFLYIHTGGQWRRTALSTF